MSDAVLGILKDCWLALLYLFVLRVLWVVGKELKGTGAAQFVEPAPVVAAPTPTVPAKAPGKSKGKAPAAWSLLVQQPEELRGVTVAVQQEITIGRGGGCAIALPLDTFVSTVHARVVPRGNDLWIEDLNSTNGTRVNDAPLGAPVKLAVGDVIQVGSSEIEVVR